MRDEPDPDGTTPVDADEAADLIPPHVHRRDELNAWEQANIVRAAEWVQRTRKPALDESTIRELHRRMFDETWRWAGHYRTSDKNIGVHWPTIPEEVRNLVDDGAYWLEHATYSYDEAAIRLHHRLVRIHPFANGNGRHARLWCDLLLRQHRRPLLEWVPGPLTPGEARERYLRALRSADRGDLAPMLDLYLKGR
ncbi:MAG: mobile mystery protein B [Longimicrobiales bacterium]